MGPHKNINKIVNMETALDKYKGTRIDRRKDVIDCTACADLEGVEGGGGVGKMKIY